ncbi:MAG: binding-protein-dependent transport system inner rane component, partial [Polaromonas sp.]|nr:binding-protein-dependent transport system inner rane component [Polaromonas sp.]
MTAKLISRWLVYGVLLLAMLLFLAPLYVMLATSFKDAAQLRTGNLLSLPASLNFEAWSLAWSSACTGTDCRGLQPFFINSVLMAVPAVLISTVWGAVNGYVLSLWKFRGSELLFGFMMFGLFMPFQVVLLPMSQVLGWLGISSSVGGLVLVHCLAGLAGTTLFFRNYYAAIPKELVNAARIDGAGFWRIFVRIILPMSTPIVMVTLIWQFTNIWNDFLFGVAFSGADSKPVTVGLNNMANTTSSV